MKILLVNSLYSPNFAGGAERSVQLTAEALKSRGVEPVILTTSDHSTVSHINDIKVYYARIPNLYWMYLAKQQPNLKKPFWHLLDARNPFTAAPLRRILSNEHPDIVHTNNLAGISVRAWDVSRNMGVPVVHTIRDHYLLCLSTTMFRNGKRCMRQCPRCRLVSWPKKRASSTVDAVVGISDSILQTHLSLGFFSATGIRTCIPNPITLRAEGQVPRDNKEKLRFGYIGQLEPSKGVEHLLGAFKSLNAPGAELYLYGRGPTVEYERRLKDQFQSPGIRFMGFKPAENIYPEIDVAVVPSLREEAFGRIVPEANSYGLPVIVSNRGGLPEIVEKGINGFVFSPEDEASLKQAMRSFIDRTNLAASMSSQCLKKAREYEAGRIAGRYIEVYRDVVGLHGQR